MSSVNLKICFLIFLGLTKSDTSMSRIIGGENAVIGQFPHQISILVGGEHRCGGSIITNRWILTAAHCIDGYGLNELQILAGTTKLNQKKDIYDVEEGKHHGKWDPNTMENDIALLKTNRIIEYNREKQPIELNQHSIEPGTSLILSGWGYTSYPNITIPNDLQFITLYSISLEKCKKEAKPETVFDSQLCTFNAIGKGACKGDSGGPLIYQEKNKLVGIVSWGKPCALGKPDIFTDVAQYLDWIEQGID